MEVSAVNTSVADNSFDDSSGSLSQRSPFEGLYSSLGENTSVESSNPFTNNRNLPGGDSNPFAGGGDSQLQQLIFNRLKLVLGENFFDGSNNPFTGSSNPNNFGSLPLNQNNAPVSNSNNNFGTNNAIVGNFNSNYGSDSATIGNGNWNFSNNNATIGNGNWSFGGNNTTIGNGNWHWDEGTNNSTLGNGNWYFGSDNQTIGNGNWDFGSNNTIIGNGNWVFTSGNTVIGNGNWLVDNSNETIGLSNDVRNLDSFLQENSSGVETLINSLVGSIGQDFIGLTGNLEMSESQIFNKLILSRGNGINNGDISPQIDQFLSLFGEIPKNQLPYPPRQGLEPVPEPTSSIPLILGGLLYLCLFKFKQKTFLRKKNALATNANSV
ncbi:hypothetical protein IQ259_13775 [Fortiea sp. LEGE XX443]|uniref:hypothetical protein n=1 Tax=Fortiea sp. LEGE XX443 TaxID=1828611 RepID=UPI001881F502|nr:hypothetical protein [Fortiea sp. LEGE XX443]MBE9006091.1 hypothetical protein [Fortiea sp. LEGE XX443]